ncbi:MAG: VanZ family protein [Granulosicoccus sp.]|nr:VanZ family protein [Granulosicoccus sp.]
MTASIILLSLINPPAQVKSLMLNDKLAHTFAYVVLMGWFAQIFHHIRARLFFALLFVAMGVGIEYLQGMTPHRQFDLWDMIANTTGVFLAWMLTFTWMGSVLAWFERAVLRTGTEIG